MEIAAELRAWYEWLPDYERVVALGVGMGGIVLQRWFADMRKRGEDLDIASVMFVGTPEQGVIPGVGSRIRTLVGHLPGFGRDPLSEFTVESDPLRSLNRDWVHWEASSSVPVYRIYGAADAVVQPAPVGMRRTDRTWYSPTDHKGLIGKAGYDAVRPVIISAFRDDVAPNESFMYQGRTGASVGGWRAGTASESP